MNYPLTPIEKSIVYIFSKIIYTISILIVIGLFLLGASIK